MKNNSLSVSENSCAKHNFSCLYSLDTFNKNSYTIIFRFGIVYILSSMKGSVLSLISNETIGLIREKTDIISLIGEYVRLIPSGRTYKALCPFHKEKTPSFHVIPDKQIYHCFGCGKGGDVFQFMMDQERLTFPEAVRFLAAKQGIEIPKEYDPDSQKIGELFGLLESATKLYQEALYTDEGKICREYIASRDFTEDTVKRFRFGYAPDSWDFLTGRLGRNNPKTLEAMEKVGLVKKRDNGSGYYDTFRGRFIFPIVDIHGRVAGFSARRLDGVKENKYINSPDCETYHKGRILFNLRDGIPIIRRQDEVVVVEGPLDAISLYQHGITNVVASCGTALTEEQVNILARNCKNIIFCYDADSAGQKANIKAISTQREAPLNARVVVFDNPDFPDDDPDEYIKREGSEKFKNLLEKAVDIYTFLVNKRTNGMKPPFEIPVKEKLIQEFKELVSEIQSPVAKSDVIRKISALLDVEPNILEKEFESKAANGSDFTGKVKNIVSPRLNAEVQRQEWILKYLLEQPEELEKIKNLLVADDFSDRHLRAIYEAICADQEAAGGELKPAEVLAMLDDDELVSRLSELIATLEERPAEPIKECIEGLVRSRLENELKLLQKRIREAEDSGDSATAAQLCVELLNIKRRLDYMRSNSQ